MLKDKYLLKSLKDLGHRIKKYREIKNLTIKDLSKTTGIRSEYLHKIEIGAAFGVRVIKHLSKIANALSVNLCDLFPSNGG